MKHEIEIQDLPEGWEAVSVKLIELESSDSEHAIYASKVLAKKKQPRRIVLEETDIDNYEIVYRKNQGTSTYWKIVEDNKCAE